MSKDEIFSKLKTILVSEFEIEEDSVTPTALLGDDLDLDSIFKTVKTVQDVVDALVPYMG